MLAENPTLKAAIDTYPIGRPRGRPPRPAHRHGAARAGEGAASGGRARAQRHRHARPDDHHRRAAGQRLAGGRARAAASLDHARPGRGRATRGSAGVSHHGRRRSCSATTWSASSSWPLRSTTPTLAISRPTRIPMWPSSSKASWWPDYGAPGLGAALAAAGLPAAATLDVRGDRVRRAAPVAGRRGGGLRHRLASAPPPARLRRMPPRCSARWAWVRCSSLAWAAPGWRARWRVPSMSSPTAWRAWRASAVSTSRWPRSARAASSTS